IATLPRAEVQKTSALFLYKYHALLFFVGGLNFLDDNTSAPPFRYVHILGNYVWFFKKLT
ncbi:MAG: hypothetical protein Q4C37_07035, partial [Bacteroidales bacterium]|nr:hypothetical protein [Bacteroidales bacterium]